MKIPMMKITFKKVAAGALITGLVAVPSLVQAHGQTGLHTATNASMSAAGAHTVGLATAAAHVQSATSTDKTGGTNSADVDTSTGATTSKTTTSGSITTESGEHVPTTTGTTATASITFEQAVSTAQSMFSTKTVVRAMLLSSKSSSPVYLVGFSDGSKVVVDGTSGTVTFSYDAATKVTTGTWPFPLQKSDDDHVSLPAVQQKLAAVSESYNADLHHLDR